MLKTAMNRRAVMSRFLQALALGTLLPAVTHSGEGNQPCTDPASDDGGLRKSLNYVEQSADPAKSCGGCGFFTGTANGCGECQILQGSVHAAGHCDSWSPQA